MANLVESPPEYSVAANTEEYAINTYIGKDAISLLSNEEFINEWRLLYESCSWATIYQSIDFIGNWYKVYRGEHLPILVVAVENNSLVGALALCLDGERQISGAGLHQAEYQTWISLDSNSDSFIQEALMIIRKRWPRHGIQLKYLPEKTPLTWISADYFSKSALLQTFEHPIMNINREMLEYELRKKNRREKVNRLKRLGELKLQRITDYTEFEDIFEELSTLNDFRKGAVYNVTSVQHRDLFREFLLGLFKAGILHVTVLKLNKEIIAANVGTKGEKWVHLQGMNAHAPAYARYSPGILHFLMLGQLLANEGFEVFDLTPGSDGYKKVLATDIIVAHQLNVADPLSIFFKKNTQAVRHQIKSLSSKTLIDVQIQRNLKKNARILLDKTIIIKNGGLRSVVYFINSALRNEHVSKWFRIDVNSNDDKASDLKVNKNCLRDLLKFKSNGTLTTRLEFLEDAMSRLEKGQQPYTLANESELLLAIWEEKGSLMMASNKNTSAEGREVRLTNLYIHPHGKGLVKEFLKQVTKKVGQENVTNLTNVYIHINSSVTAAAIQESGFIQV